MSVDWIRPIFVKFEEYANDLAADLSNLLLASANLLLEMSVLMAYIYIPTLA